MGAVPRAPTRGTDSARSIGSRCVGSRPRRTRSSTRASRPTRSNCSPAARSSSAARSSRSPIPPRRSRLVARRVSRGSSKSRTVMHRELDRLRVPRRPAPARRAQQTPGSDLQRRRRPGPVRAALRHAARGHPPGRRGRARHAREGAALGPPLRRRRRLRAEPPADRRGGREAEADRAARLGRGDTTGPTSAFTMHGRFDWAFCTPVDGRGVSAAGRCTSRGGSPAPRRPRCSRRGSRTNCATT